MRLAVLALAGLLLAGTPARAQRSAAERAAWNAPVEPFRIVGNIYYVGVAELASYLIATPAGHILVDGGLPESAPRIQASIAKLGFRARDVKWIVASHAHFDHAGGLAALKAATGAPLAIARGDVATIERGAVDHGPSAGVRFPAARVDRVLADGDTIAVGGTTLTALLTPGHTRGCTSWTTTVQEGGRPRSVIILGSTTVAGNRLVGEAAYPRIATDYLKTFARLERREFDVFLAAHASFFDMSEKVKRRGRGGDQETRNPFIERGEFRRFIRRSEAQFRRELAGQIEAAERATRGAR